MGKHSKKSKKHKKSTTKYKSSSSEEEWVEAEFVEKQKYLSKKKNKNSSESSSYDSSSSDSKREKSRKSSKRRYSSSSLSSDDDVSRKRRTRSPDKEIRNNQIENAEGSTRAQREGWMNLSTSFSSFSSQDRRKQKEQEKKQQKEAEQYNPSKCSRELNPYWKDGGDGLPKFHKPKDDDSDEDSYRPIRSTSSYVKPQSGWRKSKPESSNPRNIPASSVTDRSIKTSEGSSQKEDNQDPADTPMREKELNLIAGKLVKAEIMGNEKLIKELKEKLENGRKALEEVKLQGEEVLLTQTDRQGHSKPLNLQAEYDESAGSKKQRKKAMDTHKDKQRVRYFPDDDKYSLKQIFENEKFTSADDQDSEFMKIAANIRKNDDLDDLFADNVRRKKSDSKIDEASRSKAINEHQKMSDSLDNCSKCIQSAVMQKHLIISMGEYVYLSLPAHMPLLDGHCFIIPIRHVSSVTQLDENEWDEIRNFRKALVRLFQSKEQEPIFFEIATGFHRYPHMVLECVPLPKEEGEMAPIYFKKAIDESETEWAQNKKLVPLKGRDVRRAIPKGLSYFAVSFGMEEGFAHVIEDERLFPRNFAQEIIGGMLDLHHSKWRKPARQSFDVQSKRVLDFSNDWKKVDCTVKE